MYICMVCIALCLILNVDVDLGNIDGCIFVYMYVFVRVCLVYICMVCIALCLILNVDVDLRNIDGCVCMYVCMCEAMRVCVHIHPQAVVLSIFMLISSMSTTIFVKLFHPC